VGRYIDWADMEGHLDLAVAEPDGRAVDEAKVTKAISFAEDQFDNRLRQQYEVPFDEDDQPEAFALAQQITSLWAAGQYLLIARQSERDEATATWYADRLTKSGDKLFDTFFGGVPPDDAVAVETDFSRLPQDGHENRTTTEIADMAPMFGREHQPGRSRSW